MLYSYDDIQLSVIKDLNTRVLNSSFQKLASNDSQLVSENDYIPNIWEQKWFNDSTIAGYNKGECVWKYTMTDDQFLDQFGDSVYQYSQENERLRQYLLSSWTQVSKDSRVKAEQKPRFMNVVSGYSEIVEKIIINPDGTLRKETERVQYFSRMFDYGDGFSTAESLPTLQILMSTKDNNKDPLSVTGSWQPTVLSSYTAYQNHLSAELSLLFETHKDEYHLGGLSTMQQYDDVLLSRNLSNFSRDDLYNVVKVVDHSSYINMTGFDYVIKSHRQTFVDTVNGTAYRLYRGFRLWSSGKLEHFGIVPSKPLSYSRSSDFKDYIVSVAFDWEYDNGENTVAAEIYNYPQTSSVYDDTFALLYYAGTPGENDVIENFAADASDEYISEQMSYDVTITPVQFNCHDDLSSVYQKKTQDYRNIIKSFDDIKERSYPPNSLNKNATCLSPEVHHKTNYSFCFTKQNTDDLTEVSAAQFFYYSVTGYKTNYDLDYDITDATLNGMADVYFYTGHPIDPFDLGASLIAKNGTILRKDIDFFVECYDNIDVGTAVVEMTGKHPFRGIKTETFNIRKQISNETHRIEGLDQYYEIGDLTS